MVYVSFPVKQISKFKCNKKEKRDTFGKIAKFLHNLQLLKILRYTGKKIQLRINSHYDNIRNYLCMITILNSYFFLNYTYVEN